MSTEQNKALVRRFLEEVFNQGRLEVVDKLVAPAYIRHGMPTPVPPGPESLKQSAAAWRHAFPDVHSEVDDILAEGDRVAYRWTIRGTHQGEFMGAAGTGRLVTVSGMTFFRITDGQIVETWDNPDLFGLRQQLGLISSDKANQPSSADAMSTEPNKAVIQRLFTEVWNQKNVAVIDELFAPDFVAHRSGRPVLQGATNMKPMVEGVTRTFGADWYSTIDALIAEGDHVVTRWTLRGTHSGEWRGIAPTGKPVTITGITIHRIANGKIAELWVEEDWLGLMHQIGALPASA
jgi:steroid delta-isomerase-like uncharacterized protein